MVHSLTLLGPLDLFSLEQNQLLATLLYIAVTIILAATSKYDFHI